MTGSYSNISHDIALAFKQRRHIARGNRVCLGDVVCLADGSIIARRDLDTGLVWVTMAGLTDRVVREQLNAICQALGFTLGFFQWRGAQFFGAYDLDNHRMWHNACRAIDPTDEFPLCGPLGMLALNL